ncbi:MAG: hypothetical protein Kow00122_07000 [Thermoleophilia bacterium]
MEPVGARSGAHRRRVRTADDLRRGAWRVAAPFLALAAVVTMVSLVSLSGLLPVDPRPAALPVRQAPSTTIVILSGDGAPAGGDGASGGGSPAAGSEGPAGGVPSSQPAAPGATQATSPGPESARSGGAGAGVRSYVVEKGDTPASIARRFGVSTERLLEFNGITDPTSLRVGTELRIPPA